MERELSPNNYLGFGLCMDGEIIVDYYSDFDYPLVLYFFSAKMEQYLEIYKFTLP